MEKEKEKKYKREYMKEYMQRPEPKRKRKLYLQTFKYKAMKKEWDKRYRNKPGMNLIKNRVARKWRKRPEVMEKQNKYKKLRREKDVDYAIKDNIRSNFYLSLKKYSKTGKIKPLKEYKINMKAIIKHLKPFPKDRENYHIDHIVPLKMFNHSDPKQIKKAWLPSNLQWLTIQENLEKGDRLVIPHYNQGGRA